MAMGSVSDLAYVSSHRSLHISLKQIEGASRTKVSSPLATEPAEKRSDHTDGEEPEFEENYKDQGYAWVIMVAGLLGMMCHGGISTTSTLTYQQLRPRFEMTATAAGWVTALHGTVRMFSSPLVSLMCYQLSNRTVAMTGGFLYSIGLVIMGFAPSPFLVYIGYGVISAIGSNMFILCTFVMISQYFDKKRGKAMGVSFCGAGLGTIIFSPLIAYLFDNIGFTRTILIEAGIVLQMCVSASLYRPPPEPKSKEASTNSLESSSQPMVPHSALKKTSLCCLAFIRQLGVTSLRHSVFFYVCILCSSLMGEIFCAYIYTAGLAFETGGIGDTEMAMVLSIGGFSEMPARLMAGILLDFAVIRPNRLYVFGVIGIFSGTFFLSLQFARNFVSMTVIWAFYQATTLALHTQHVVIMGETLPPDELPGGIGISRVFQGIGLTIGPTLIGLIKDNAGTYTYGYILIGGLHVLLSLILLPVSYCFYNRKRQVLYTETMQVDAEQ